MSTEEKRMVTTQECAKMAGMSDSNLRNWIRKGWITPASQIGGTWLFTLEQVQEVIARRAQKKSK